MQTGVEGRHLRANQARSETLKIFGRNTMSTQVESGPRMPLVASVLLGRLAENWWLLLLRGLAAIAFGVIAFLWPAITLVALTYLFGIYCSSQCGRLLSACCSSTRRSNYGK